MRKISAVLLAAAAGLAVASCHQNVPPVARLEVQPRSIRLPFGQLATLHLAWTPLSALPGDSGEPNVFVHLLDAKGKLLRTFDHPYPQRWVEGSPVAYDVKVCQSAIATPIAAGSYRLSVGIYDHAGKRWPLDGLGAPIGRNEYLAANVNVAGAPANAGTPGRSPAQADTPRFVFSPQWLPAEAGSDLQVLASRWLGTEPGTLSVEGIRGPGAVWLMLRIPAGDHPNEKLVLHAGGSNAPSVMVRGTCGGAETGLSGPGRHEVEMPVDAPGAGGTCSFTLTPNFHLVSADIPQPRSVALENAAWNPGRTAAAAPPAEGGAAAPAAPTEPSSGAAKPPGR
jgi:hypothetical protein